MNAHPPEPSLSRTRGVLERAARVLLSGALLLAAPAATAQTLGMVTDDATDSVTVFDAETDTVLGSVALPVSGDVRDCTIDSTGGFGYVTSFTGEVWVIDLAGPSLAAGVNPIPISGSGQDAALSADGGYLLVCGSGIDEPLSSVDLASRAEVDTLALPAAGSCKAVAVCADGSVLTTWSNLQEVRRFTLDGSGMLSDTGESLSLPGPANDLFCAPGGTSAAVVVNFPPRLQSFGVPGLTPVDLQPLSTFFDGISGQIHPDGDRAYVRQSSSVAVFNFDEATGVIGGPSLLSFPVTPVGLLHGVERLALHPGGQKVYVPQTDRVDVFDPDGGLLTSLTDPALVAPTGICLGPGAGPAGPVVQDIPTLDPMGLALLALVLGTLAVSVLRRRKEAGP